MNIKTSAAPAFNYQPLASTSSDASVTLSSSREKGRNALTAIGDHPFRSVADVVTLGSVIGDFATANDTPTGAFFRGASLFMGCVHAVSAASHAVAAGDTLPEVARSRGVTAMGEALTAVGHGASFFGAGAVGVGVVAFGTLITTLSDFNR